MENNSHCNNSISQLNVEGLFSEEDNKLSFMSKSINTTHELLINEEQKHYFPQKFAMKGKSAFKKSFNIRTEATH